MIDAALLAAAAPPGGVLPPADETAELAYLDLRADCPAVAESKARAVAVAFGPSLYLRASLRLVVASGKLPPAEVAGWLARTSAPGNHGGTASIAAVRGEDVLDRLEELMLAGCDLACGGNHGGPPIAAWAPTPAAVVRNAVASGAAVIVSRFAAPDEVSLAVEAERQAESVAAPQSLPIDLVFPGGYHLRIDAASREELAEALGQLPAAITEPCTIHFTEYEGFSRLDITATDLAGLTEFARRFELAAPAGLFGRPLIETITPRHRRATASVPAELLEFGVDVRPADDWSNS